MEAYIGNEVMVVNDDLLKCLILLGFSFRFPFVIKLNRNATLLFVIVYYALNHGFLEDKHEGHGGPRVLALARGIWKNIIHFLLSSLGLVSCYGILTNTPFGMIFIALIY